MTKYISAFNDIIRLIRPRIISALSLPPDRVLNAASLTGPDLMKIIGNEASGISIDDPFIIFELLENESGDLNGVSEEYDGTMTDVSAFNFNLKFYGNTAHDLAVKTAMYFKRYDNAVGLQEDGIYIQSVTSPRGINEFINNLVWPRCDLTLSIYVRFNYGILAYDGYADETYAENINRLHIHKV